MRFILAPVVLLVSCQSIAAQQVVPAPPVFAAPPPSPPVIVQPGPAPTILPPQSTVVPLPSHAPGSIFGPPTVPSGVPPAPVVAGPELLPAPPPVAVGPVSPLADVAPGGMVSPQFGLPPGPDLALGPVSSISLPPIDDQLLWDQIADVVSEYFRIAREQQVRRSGEVWQEGCLETAPQSGATWLEPHRKDSVGTFNRWESTFQTIRRRAVIKVTPDTNGYVVEAIVEKELEDLPRPEKATAGSAVFRTDGSLPSRRLEEVSRERSSPRWIRMGRDPALEQRMLADIHARLTGVASGTASVFAQ